jgi:glutaredoxin
MSQNKMTQNDQREVDRKKKIKGKIMKDKITVYERPTCSKCREMAKLLKEAGVDFDKINYYVEPLSASQDCRTVEKDGHASTLDCCAPAKQSIKS